MYNATFFFMRIKTHSYIYIQKIISIFVRYETEHSRVMQFFLL